MKKLLLAIAVTCGASFQANAAAPLWTCKLTGKIDGTTSQLELILIRGEEVTGHGVVVCRDAFGHKVRNSVNLHITSGGIGPAFNGPLEGLTIVAARAGVSTIDGMIGQYDLSAGPRFGLIHGRVGIMAGAQISGQGAGAGVEAVIENRFSVGLDLGGMVMTVTPARGGKRR